MSNIVPNTNELTYNGFVTQLCTMAVVNFSTVAGIVTPTDVAVQAIMPSLLNYAEQRIQRDLDLQSALTSSQPGDYTLQGGSNTLALNPNDFITVETISLTVGTAQIPLLPVSKEYIQNVYNDSSFVATPQCYAMTGGDQATGGMTANNVLFGPYADLSYAATITGVQWLPSLYSFAGGSTTAAANTTFISSNLSDLLMMAALVFVSAYQRNFGRESDDPQMAQSYENQYQMLLKSAMQQEYRKKFAASAWSSSSQPIVATPTR